MEPPSHCSKTLGIAKRQMNNSIQLKFKNDDRSTSFYRSSILNFD
jgi:hypothetical protein